VRSCACALAVLLFATQAFAAEEERKTRKSEAVFLTPAFGISYPFVVSIGAGALLPMGKSDPNVVFPSIPALRADIEAGLGGGSIAAGVHIPAGAFAFNAKAASLRTWLLAWGQESDRTYDGAIFEVVMQGHVPGKIGLGRFKERAQGDRERDKLTYLFLGVGF
jgi:hypothetical protein